MKQPPRNVKLGAEIHDDVRPFAPAQSGEQHERHGHNGPARQICAGVELFSLQWIGRIAGIKTLVVPSAHFR